MSDIESFNLKKKNIMELEKEIIAGMYVVSNENVKKLTEENARLRELIHNLADRHRWQPMMGECVCEYHQKVKALEKSE